MKAKKVTTPSNPGDVNAMRILKVGTCGTLTGKSTLTYHVGCVGAADIHFRVYANSGGGFYSKEWVPASEIQRILKKMPLVTSAALLPIFKGRSANNGGFLLSVLKEEGLFARSPDKPRSYIATESPDFVAELQVLIESGANLDPDAKPSKKTPPVKAASRTSKTVKAVKT